MKESEKETVDPTTHAAPGEAAPATLPDVHALLHELTVAVAGLTAEVRTTRADASQDAIELRARTRWLEGRIETLEGRIEALEGASSEPAGPAQAPPAPAGGRKVAATAGARRKRKGAAAGKKPREAARIKATMSAEEIRSIRAEKRARRP
jgi:hypothetical protein